MNNLKYAIEGILFAAGEPVKAAMLAVALDTDIDNITNAVAELREEYDLNHRGLAVIDIDEGFQLCSRPEYYAYIQVILGEQRKQALSNAAMEVLAIIAYKQPITRSGIEFIRGVNSDGAVNRLVERGLVEEQGRLDAPGRPILYGTTQNFLRCFGLSTLDGLPEIDLSKLNENAPESVINELAEALGTSSVNPQDIIPGQVNIDEVMSEGEAGESEAEPAPADGDDIED